MRQATRPTPRPRPREGAEAARPGVAAATGSHEEGRTRHEGRRGPAWAGRRAPRIHPRSTDIRPREMRSIPHSCTPTSGNPTQQLIPRVRGSRRSQGAHREGRKELLGIK